MLQPELLGRFTTHLKEALQKGLSFAIRHGRDVVEPGDLLVGLLLERGSIAAEILTKANVTVEAAESAFRGTPAPHAPGTPLAPDLSQGVKRLLEKCVLTAHLHEHKYIGTEHLLSALIDTPLPDIHAFFQQCGLNLDAVREQITGVLKSTSKFPDLTVRQAADEEIGETDQGAIPQDQRLRPARGKQPKMLDAFARDLTHPDTVAKLDPVIGRDEETERVMEILCRRVKNNPILLGDPGVGKTAIVEGLAQRLAAGDVPDALQGRRLMAVDLALMVAGTMYRGEFEARLKQLVEEAKTDQNVILFIDEVHNMVGAGSTSGSLDAANILKPALARGEIHCIGATTWAEYKKHIEPDAALERRYQPVDVREPSAEMARRMLEGLKGRYEEHHGVRFPAETLDASVHLAERYLTDRFFPDKAIDLLDEAAAHVSARRRSQESMERMRALDVAIEASREAKEIAVTESRLEAATKSQEDEERLSKERKNLEKQMATQKERERLPVTAEHVARVVARLTHVPVETVLQAERERLVGLEEALALAVVGQVEAVKAVADVVRKARLGLTDPRRPKASLMFVGPSGVGKTELARTLARQLFGREQSLVKLDMSEFAEGHSVSKLLGSPAGYVGYREGNRMTDAIRKNPHSVLLFDEFEKAHADVQHLLLQALEDGQISDSTGRPISFRHSYIILTSNVGSEFVHRSPLGFGGAEDSANRYQEQVKTQLTDRFRPELLNRLDRIVIFQPLDRNAMRSIIRRELEAVLARLTDAQKVAYSAGDDVLDWLLDRDLKSEEGARAARRIVEAEVTALLSQSLVDNPKKRSGTLKVQKDKLKIA